MGEIRLTKPATIQLDDKSFWCVDKTCDAHAFIYGCKHFHFKLIDKNFIALVQGSVQNATNYIRVMPIPDTGNHFIDALQHEIFPQSLDAVDDIVKYKVGKFLKKHRKELLAC